MEILVTNDDSYSAEGINVVARMLSAYGTVTVVAPEYPQSGKSAALTLDSPLRCRHIGSEEGTNSSYTINSYALTGTPADCIKWAANYIFTNSKPDFIVSGINHGSNASAASVYSGTLGAAAEGTLYGVPSLGISIDTHNPSPDFSAINRYLPPLLEKILDNPPMEGVYLNINFPYIPVDQIKGYAMASQGKGKWVREFEKRRDPKGKDYYWMTGNFEDMETSATGDHKVVEQGYISIVPHKTDTTDYAAMLHLGRIWNIPSEI